MKANQEIISLDEAITLAGLFKERTSRTPERIAYRYYDPEQATWKNSTWSEMRS